MPATAGAFKQFGPAHLTMMGITVFFCIALPIAARRSTSERLSQSICRTLAVLLVAGETLRALHLLMAEGWDSFIAQGLPLHVCGISIYLTAYTLLAKKQLIFEIVYFWATAGTLQALLTPDLEVGFPSGRFVFFFIGHGGIMVSVIFAVFGLRMRPRWKGLWITYGLSWGVVGLIGLLNVLMGTNYMYLRQPPPGHTPFFFLPWPWYIPFLGAVGLVLFFLFWLPFCTSRKPAPAAILNEDTQSFPVRTADSPEHLTAEPVPVQISSQNQDRQYALQDK